MNKLKICISFLATFLVLLTPTSLSAAEYYTWVDENGVTNYAERQPRGYVVERVEKEQRFGYPVRNQRMVEAPPAADPAGGGNFNADDAASEEIARAAAELQEARTTNCDVGKRNYAQLKVFARVRVQGDDGNVRYLTDDEKQEQMAAAQQLISDNCGPG